jgi:glycosyltransferase involved in cell wall biosynthesis
MVNKNILMAATVYTHLANFHKPAIKLLQQKGYEVHAVANNNEGRKEEIEELGVVCHDINFVRFPFKKENILAMKELSMLFRSHYFHLIHVHTPIAAFIVRYLAKKYKQGSVIYTAHGFHFYKGAPLLNWLLYYPAEKVAKKWTDGLVVMNKEDFSQGKKLGFIPNYNLFLTKGVGVDLTKFNDSRESTVNFRYERNIQKDDIVITCIAEFTKNKNQLFLIEAWKELIKKYKNIHLLFVGHGSQFRYLKRIVDEQCLKNTHFLGYRYDIPEILKHSTIITLVSRREGLPKTLMEGMAAGLPAVVTNVRGARDLVTHNENGFVVELGNKRELIKQLSTLISDEEVRIRMGQNAMRKVRRYSNKEVLVELDQVYKRFLD